MSPQEKAALDIEARVQQMQINTRLTALQTALELLKLRAGADAQTATLLDTAKAVETYILGDLVAKSTEAIERALRPRPTILRAR